MQISNDCVERVFWKQTPKNKIHTNRIGFFLRSSHYISIMIYSHWFSDSRLWHFFFWSDLFQWFWFLVAFNSLFRNSKSESVIQSFYTNFVYCNVLVVVSIHQTMCLCFFQHIRLVRSERHLQLQTVVECTHDSLHNADRFETTRNFGYTRMERRLYSIIIVYLWWLKLDKCEQQQYTKKKQQQLARNAKWVWVSSSLFFYLCVMYISKQIKDWHCTKASGLKIEAFCW